MKTFKEWLVIREADDDDMWGMWLLMYQLDPENPFNPIKGLVDATAWAGSKLWDAISWLGNKVKGVFASAPGTPQQKAQAAYNQLSDSDKARLKNAATSLKAQQQQQQIDMATKRHS
jgi:hypothetical protein